MVVGGNEKNTVKNQSLAILEECYSLLIYLRENIAGPVSDKGATEKPSLANPIDEAIANIQEARKVIAETKDLLASELIDKLG